MNLSRMKICFVLLPGFSPDSKPVLALKRAIEKQGYTALVSGFFGNVSIVDFQKLTISECQNNISNLINQTALKYDKVIGVGMSLGGALLLEHAKTKNNLYGIVSIGTPFRLKSRQLMRMGEFIFPVLYPFWKRFEKIKRLRLPPIGAGQVVIQYLENEFLQKLDKIHTPVLFLHSKKDLVTDYESLPKYTTQLSHSRSQTILTENGSHVIAHDPNYIIDKAINFLSIA